MSNSLRPPESQHTRPPCPSPTPGVHPNSCASSRCCHPAILPAISSSIVPFSSCPQSLPASESFPMSQLLVITFLPRSKHLLISWLQSPSAIIPRLIHRFKANSIKISVGIFTQKIEIDKPLLNFIQKGKETRIAKTNC